MRGEFVDVHTNAVEVRKADVTERDARLCIGDDDGDFKAAQTPVERHEDRAGARAGEVQYQHLRAVAREHGDAIAWSTTVAFGEHARTSGDIALEVGVGPAPLARQVNDGKAARLRREPGFDARALRGLTALFTGGAPHPAPDIRAWLRDGIPVVDGYGMSEAGTVFGMPVDLALIERKAGCVGFGTPAIRARIVDALERDCAADEPGELLLCGPNVFGGYWRRPVESAAAFTGDGWFRTGDIAVRDSDGYFRLVDRKKDMYISGGENVYPVEVEAALSGFPGLVECAVVAVPDEQWGEVGVCLLVVAAGAQVNEMQLTRYLRERIAHYKIPKRYVYVERLPRTGSGKVRKSDLRALLSHGPRPEPD